MEIGKKEYKSYIMVGFNNTTSRTLDVFDNLSNLDIFFQTLSLEYNKRLYPRESLIIFDEIQKFPKARQVIKYLVADGRYDYIETGSLISIRENVENRNDIEIDFLLSNDSKINFGVFSIEVKSSKNYTATSFGRFKEMFENELI